jgi:hypothetical protein
VTTPIWRKAPEWARVKAKREFDRCVKLAKEDPFSELPARPDGYRQSSFWNALALTNNDPLAQARQAASVMSGLNGDPAYRNKKVRLQREQSRQCICCL